MTFDVLRIYPDAHLEDAVQRCRFIIRKRKPTEEEIII